MNNESVRRKRCWAAAFAAVLSAGLLAGVPVMASPGETLPGPQIRVRATVSTAGFISGENESPGASVSPEGSARTSSADASQDGGTVSGEEVAGGTADASGADASGADASGVDAADADAAGADDSGADASGADAAGADFSSGSDSYRGGQGMLTITAAAVDSIEKTSTPVPGLEVLITKIADLDTETKTYTLDSAYSAQLAAYRTQTGVTKEYIFDGMTTSQSNVLARLIAGAGTPDATAYTSEEGKVTFTGLSDGMYLVQQGEQVEGFSPFDPFLVSVPLYESGSWDYNVSADPKTIITESETETSSETTPSTNPSTNPSTSPSTGGGNTPGTSSNVKTGDDNPLSTYIGLLMISGIVALGIITGRKKKEN